MWAGAPRGEVGGCLLRRASMIMTFPKARLSRVVDDAHGLAFKRAPIFLLNVRSLKPPPYRPVLRR